MQETGTRLIAGIIHDAGGEVIGSTRLQKIAYLLEIAGYSDGFRFGFRNCSPYSDEVAEAATTAVLLGDLSEVEETAAWGGKYSIFRAELESASNVPPGRRELATAAAHASAIELDLAATAVFLSLLDCPDPWGETKRRKPDLAKGRRLNKAKKLLEKLRSIEVPAPLPAIP